MARLSPPVSCDGYQASTSYGQRKPGFCHFRVAASADAREFLCGGKRPNLNHANARAVGPALAPPCGMSEHISAFLADTSAVTTIEYGAIAVGIAISIAAVLMTVGDHLRAVFEHLLVGQTISALHLN